MYDTGGGRPSYIGDNLFMATKYIEANDVSVNCYDQAYATATFGNLLGMQARPHVIEPFGYMNTCNLVGIGMCNNPLFDFNTEMEYLYDLVETNGNFIIERKVVGVFQSPRYAICPIDETRRSFFSKHVFVLLNRKVYDACIGPICGTGAKGDYLHSLIDHSTENEALLGCFSPVSVPITDEDANLNYQIE